MMKLVKTVNYFTIAEHDFLYYVYDDASDFDLDMEDGVPSRWSVETTSLQEAERSCVMPYQDDHRLTEHQAAVLTAFTGLMIGKFSPFHTYAEQLLGRRILTHEFGDKEMADKLKDLSKDDFLNLQP